MRHLILSAALPALLMGACATAPAATDAAPLTEAEQRLSGALMRVNHVGEICAQAL